MSAPYIHTPRTVDASYLSNEDDRIDDLSPEKSFAAIRGGNDLVSQMRVARKNGMNLKTPRLTGRDPLKLLPNGSQPQGKPEFTPLLRSVARTNISRRLSTRKSHGVETPAHLRNSYVGGATPALPRMEEESNIQSEHTGSSAGRLYDITPMPQNLNSSPQSTPLVSLPGREAVVNDGNMMTLREQENIIDKIEKENFGLKMKIHFLEEAISKRGGEFNQAALKENTDLKVNRITMQRELHKFKKTLVQAERDAEIYRQQLDEYKERIRRKQLDESIRIEVESMRSEIKAKAAEFNELRSKYDSVKTESKNEIERLRGDVEDLHAEIRQKDRDLETHEDEIDSLKANTKKESYIAVELEEKFESARQKIQDLKDDLEHARRQAQEAKDASEDVLAEKRRSEQDLDDLRDEIANKSFTEKGLSRRMDERVERLREENEELQERCNSIKLELDTKTRSERQLQDQLQSLDRDGVAETRHLQQELEMVQQQRDTFERKYNTSCKQVESLEHELKDKRDEKDLLQTRHDALTNESAELQKELNRERKTVKDFESALKDERQRAAQNDDFLRSQHKTEVGILNEQIDQMHNDVEVRDRDFTSEREEWETLRRNLEATSRRAEEKASGLQRTVDKLQDVQGTLSGSEMKLQEALESEKQRHLEEEKILSKQIMELNNDLAAKRLTAEQGRTELNNAREELRGSIREQALLKEKIIELEDEIEVLQADIEQEHEFIQQLQSKTGQATDALVVKLRKEKQELQDSLATLNAEVQGAKASLLTVESERDRLETKLQMVQKSADDTFDMQQEKRELRRIKQSLEKELEKVRVERDNLSTANDALEAEINAELDRATAEENRVNGEMSQLKIRLDARERELSSAKTRTGHLENRIQDLEQLLENRSQRLDSPGADISGLRHDLVEARKLETAATKREQDLKSTNRDLKMQINELERELHEARLTSLKSRSPSISPPPSHSKELAQLRQEVVNVQASVRELEIENLDLKRKIRRSAVGDTERIELEARAKEFAAKLVERDNQVTELNAQLQRLRQDHREARNSSVSLRPTAPHTMQIAELKSQIKRLRAERDDMRDNNPNEARELKQELHRLREDRARANQKAEDIEKELESMQLRYEGILERLSLGGRGNNSNSDDIRAKEIRGLIREVVFLKAKLRREERLRTDLAWTKTYLEQGEAIRVQCNQIDLRILREMGVDVERHRRKLAKPLTPKQKLRAGVFAVVAAIRMRKMEQQWKDKKALGESLRRARSRQTTT